MADKKHKRIINTPAFVLLFLIVAIAVIWVADWFVRLI
jgi:preprotein translocase subunit SecE